MTLLPAVRPSRDTTRGVRDLAHAVLALGMAGVAVVSVGRAAAAGSVATSRLFGSSDDAFYYFTVASRWAHGQGSTFDGLQATNGYQPLWFWINALVFRVTGDDTAGVVVVVCLTAALWVAAVALVRAVAEELDAGWAGVAAVAVLAVVSYRTWFGAMEFGLVGTILLATVWVFVRGGAWLPTGPDPRTAVVLGVLGAVGVLARLDSAAVVAVLAAAVLVCSQRATLAQRLRVAVAMVGPALGVLAVYLVVNAHLFDSAIPMSGRAKQLGHTGVPRWSDLTDYLMLTLGGRVRFLGVWIVVGVAVALVLLARSSTLRARTSTRPALTALLAVLVVAQAAQLAYYTATSSWELESWYFGLTVPTVVVVTLVLVLAVPSSPRVRRVARGAVVGLAVLVVARAGLEEARAAVDPDTTSAPIAATVATARWVDASLPPDATLAMGDWAGAFGYATTHAVVQTEGLVASRGYLDALERGQGGEFLTDVGVGYYVKIGTNGELARDGTCSVYEEPVYGAGPILRVRVCDDDLVRWTPGPTAQGDVRVWRVTPATWSG